MNTCDLCDHHDAQHRIVRARKMGEFDAVHPAGQADVGDQQGWMTGLDGQQRGFGVLALDHVEIAFLQQRRNDVALNVVVLNHDRGAAERF